MRNAELNDMSYVTRSPISLDFLVAEVASPECGGTCLFLGTVRNGPGAQGVTAIETWASDEVGVADVVRGQPHAAPPAREPAAVRDGPLQPALPLLHAGGRLRVAAADLDPHLRGDRAAHRRVRRARVHKVRLTGGEPLLRHDLSTLVA